MPSIRMSSEVGEATSSYHAFCDKLFKGTAPSSIARLCTSSGWFSRQLCVPSLRFMSSKLSISRCGFQWHIPNFGQFTFTFTEGGKNWNRESIVSFCTSHFDTSVIDRRKLGLPAARVGRVTQSLFDGRCDEVEGPLNHLRTRAMLRRETNRCPRGIILTVCRGTTGQEFAEHSLASLTRGQ